MSKTKIVIIQLKEIIYTAIFVGLGILLILLLVFMFLPKNNDTASSSEQKYKAGVYTSQLALNNTALNLEIVLDEDHINSVRIVNIDEAITTMYPLVQPALDDINEQLYNDVPIDDIVIDNSKQFTQTMLLEAIETTLAKAKVE